MSADKSAKIVLYILIALMFLGFFTLGLPEYIHNTRNPEQFIDSIIIYKGIDTTYIDTIWHV